MIFNFFFKQTITNYKNTKKMPTKYKKDTKKYKDRFQEAQSKTDSDEALSIGVGTIKGKKVVSAIFEFDPSTFCVTLFLFFCSFCPQSFEYKLYSLSLLFL